MEKKQKKYLIIGLELVLLLLLLFIVIYVSTGNFNGGNTGVTDSFTHSGNITSTSAERIVNEYGNYTLEIIKYSDGSSEQRLYLNSGNETQRVSTTLRDSHDIVVGII